jgi:hypothetical protein
MNKDVTNQRFGRLIAVGPAARDKWGQVHWLCKCDCGQEKVIRGKHLWSMKIRSCGCLNMDERKKRLTKHGHASNGVISPINKIWQGMKKRCFNSRDVSYPRYGARGIKVCDRWLDFRNFLADMGDRPPGMTIERIDNAGNYEPGNCKWATAMEQSANTRKNRMITANGKTLHMSAWARELELNIGTIRWRLNNGWSAERALGMVQ